MSVTRDEIPPTDGGRGIPSTCCAEDWLVSLVPGRSVEAIFLDERDSTWLCYHIGPWLLGGR